MTAWQRSYVARLKTVVETDLEIDRVADELHAASTLGQTTSGWERKLAFLRTHRANLTTPELFAEAKP